jgi:hypothetical protein
VAPGLLVPRGQPGLLRLALEVALLPVVRLARRVATC